MIIGNKPETVEVEEQTARETVDLAFNSTGKVPNELQSLLLREDVGFL